MAAAHEILLLLLGDTLAPVEALQALDDILLPELPASPPAMVSRAQYALALTAALHHDLLRRVPTAAAYVADCRAAGRKVVLDHGALRTIALPGGAPTGALPSGVEAIGRILEPLGYRIADEYPLDRLRMTGFAYCHQDLPDGLAQFFVSVLHVDRFESPFQDAAARIFSTSRDPLDKRAMALLDIFRAKGMAPIELARAALPALAGAFDRQHMPPSIEDYELLKAHSAEAAWIATEGNAFNHGTDRVEDVAVTADVQRASGRAMKDRIECSGSGRVRQTAFRADWVERRLWSSGELVTRSVPGSFYEFISRDVDPATGQMDLKFDSANAQGIFKMTAALDA